MQCKVRSGTSLILLLCGLCVLLYPMVSNWYEEMHHGEVIRTYQDDVAKMEDEEITGAWAEAAAYNRQLQELVQKPAEEWDFVESIDGVFEKYIAVTAKEEAQKLVVNGNRIPSDMIADFSDEKCKEQVRLYDNEGRFIGIYTYLDESKEYKPVKMFME